MTGIVDIGIVPSSVAPSKQFSDHLYHFDKGPDRIIDALLRGGFTLNYVVEDYAYLGVDSLGRVAFPMLCFCDIADEKPKLELHMKQYGDYGIGLSKEWGKRQGVQPVHYILPGSPFALDFAQAINAAMALGEEPRGQEIEALADFLITTMAYAKPLWGIDNGKQYCYEDECEWRFIPSDLPQGLPRLIPDPSDGQLENYKGTLWRPQSYLLDFSYDEVSDIFVKKGMSPQICGIINQLDISAEEKDLLKTRVREG